MSIPRIATLVAIELVLLITPMMFPTIPDWLGLGIYGFAFLLFVYAGIAYAADWQSRSRKASDTNLARDAPAISSFDEGAQQQLVRALREIGRYDDGPSPNAKINIEALIHAPLGDMLKSIFNLAGWTTNYNSTPQEHFTHRYREGIEVGGSNSLVVRSVSKALSDAGLPVQPITIITQIKPDNPKYLNIQRGVRIIIDHTKKFG